MKRIIKRVFTFGIALAACFFITAVYLQKTQAASANTMTIYAIDLGQDNEGEATMVVSGNGASLLIDTGDSNTKNLFSWLKSNGYKDKKFDILLTHWHDDHVLYTARLIKDYNIGTVYIPGTEYLDNQYYRNIYSSILSIAKTRKTKVVYLKKRMQIDVGNNVVGKVLYVNGYYGNGSKLERFNNQSAAIMFTGGGSRFLACGDAMKAEENALLSSGESLRADIFKMNHHGYPSSNTRDFIKRVNPSYAWFTTHDATPEHYNPESVKEIVRRTSATANMLSTRYNGTIRYLCSGGSISVSAERNVCKMYRRARNKKTGDEKTFTFTLNKQAVPKITDKMINSNVYTSWQVDQNGNTFSGKLVYDSNGNCYLRDTSGMYAVDTFAKADDKYYWLEENGRRFAKGWKVLDGKGITLLHTG